MWSRTRFDLINGSLCNQKTHEGDWITVIIQSLVLLLAPFFSTSTSPFPSLPHIIISPSSRKFLFGYSSISSSWIIETQPHPIEKQAIVRSYVIMSVFYPVSILVVIVYLSGIALLLTILILLIQVLVLSIRALKKYLQS